MDGAVEELDELVALLWEDDTDEERTDVEEELDWMDEDELEELDDCELVVVVAPGRVAK